MKSTVLAFLLAVSSLLALMSPAVSAAPEDEEIPNIRLLFEEKQYKVGDLVNFTVEVTANGRYVDPNWPGIVVAIAMDFSIGGGGPGGIDWLDEDNITQVDTGVFEGFFTIEAKHVTLMEAMYELPIMGKVVAMMVMCSYGPPTAVQAMSLALLWLENGPGISVTFDEYMPSPGDEVNIYINTYNHTNGEYFDVVPHDVKVEIYAFDGLEQKDLGKYTALPTGPGKYKASFMVPVDLDTATDYHVHVGASFPDYNHSSYLSPIFDPVFTVRFFDLWGQNVSMTDTETNMAIWVADLDGKALSGAQVDSIIRVYDGELYQDHTFTNTTGADGAVQLSVSHTTADRIDLNGTVSHNGLSQRFMMEAFVDNREPTVSPPEGDDEGFSVNVYETPENGPFFDHVKLAGDKVTNKYRAYNASGPFPNKRINWYVVDRESFFDTNYTVLESGYEVSDASGDFSLTFTVPTMDTSPWLLFEAVDWNADDERFERAESSNPLFDSGYFPVDDSIDIHVDLVDKADPVEVRANMVLPRNSFVAFMSVPFDEETGLQNWGPLQNLGAQEDDGMNIRQINKVGVDQYGIDMIIPEFLPEDMLYGFVILTLDLDRFHIVMNYEALGYGESTEKAVDATVPEPPEPIHAGINGSFDLIVNNTGQGIDTYTVEVTSGPEGWLEPSVGEVTMDAGEYHTVTFNVSVPEGTDEDTYLFNVTVTSKDETVNMTTEVAVDVLVNGVRATLDWNEATAFREDVLEFILTLNNTGQGNDTYVITAEGSAVYWATVSDYSVFVPEGSDGETVVQLVVPVLAIEELYYLDVTATSADGVTGATVRINVSVLVDAVDVSLGPDLIEALPGDTVELTLEVTNEGMGPDTFALTLEDENTDWATLAIASVDIEEGASANVTVIVEVPSDADEDFYNISIRATSANGVTNATTTAKVHVLVSGVDLVASPEVAGGRRGEMLTFMLNVTNTGQGEDTFSLTPTSALWADHITYGSNPVAIDEGAFGEIMLTVRIKDTADEDVYTLTITATSADGRTTATATLTITVTVNDLDAVLSEISKKVKQGKSVTATLTVRNTGQGPDTFTVLVTGAAANWTTLDTTVLDLAEGDEGTVTITIAVPKKAAVGDNLLDVTIVSTDSEVVDMLQFQVTVEKAGDDGPGPGALAAIVATVMVAAVLVASRRRRP